jgi:hypothetical protein
MVRVIVVASLESVLSVIVRELDERLIAMNGEARRRISTTEMTSVCFRPIPFQMNQKDAPPITIGMRIANDHSL